jgi:S1-C subfamily serine protease
MAPTRLLVPVVLALCFIAQAKEPDALPEYLYQGTYFIQSKVKEGTAGGLGSGIDMSRYGYSGKRCIITVYHVLAPLGIVSTDIQVLIKEGKEGHFIRAKLIAFDKEQDVALLETSQDLPFVNKLASKDRLKIGSPLCLTIMPGACGPVVKPGHFCNRGDTDGNWETSIGSRSGYSGGSIWDPIKKEIVGLMVAGYKDANGFCPDIGFFVPWTRFDKLFKDNKDKILKITK